MRHIPANFFFWCFAIFGIAILAMLFYLQIVKGEYYQALALGQQMSSEENNAKRGDIFFNDGKTILSQTKIKPVAYISFNKIPTESQAEILKTLASVFKEDEQLLKIQLEQTDTIRKDLTEEQYKILKQKNLKYIALSEILVRVYPQQKFACHISGFVNGEGAGQYGVEGYYDSVLKGKTYIQGKNPIFSVLNGAFSSSANDLETNGKSLQLTIDYNIQYEAEKLLEQAFSDWQMDAGQIIIQEPQTGRILAFAAWPEFNPNLYANEKGMAVFANNSIQALFEPGSVFKPVAMAAGLEENLITPQTKFTDTGEVNMGGPSIYNFAKKVWGEQSMVGVLENSINTGMVFVEQKLGKSLFLKYIQRFGFFEKTGVDLSGEIYSANETLKKGYPRDFAVASFGQGIQITSLQLVQAISAIANGGKMTKPYVVEKIIESNGQEQIQEPVVKKQVISENTASQLAAMMVAVVENGGGRRAKVPGYLVAGKTGTAQIPKPRGGYYENETIQSFVGFAPANQPRFVILVRMDNPKQSDAASSCAAPVFGKLAKYIIDLWQIPPTNTQ